ncbi:hypothetical protein M419DRAFT_130794 [Trichoderma reesei RUT C-30]|uniref:Uncharacterized protein n=1 Tax=Hypocrea jecorina (strain ATCC 56765 / BCRC 32924 / NRRL 11460 / Rut C-30) TaxID=1344414 RepID=A0A024S728_HYPJR|nr:hypothetical protein M419DRAFT_130794 [Trichoderma reesei RUT C-30]
MDWNSSVCLDDPARKSLARCRPGNCYESTLTPVIKKGLLKKKTEDMKKARTYGYQRILFVLLLSYGCLFL